MPTLLYRRRELHPMLPWHLGHRMQGAAGPTPTDARPTGPTVAPLRVAIGGGHESEMVAGTCKVATHHPYKYRLHGHGMCPNFVHGHCHHCENVRKVHNDSNLGVGDGVLSFNELDHGIKQYFHNVLDHIRRGEDVLTPFGYFSPKRKWVGEQG